MTLELADVGEILRLNSERKNRNVDLASGPIIIGYSR